MPLFSFVRGRTGNAGNVAFRKWYSFLNELRSLVSNGLPFMALTATASKHTKREIFRVLEFTTPHEIVESPDRRNIVYVCQQIDNYFGWLIDAIKEQRKDAELVLVYCQTVKQCASLYQLFADNLAKCMYSDKSFNSQKRLVQMLYSKTPESVKTECWILLEGRMA